MNAMISQLNHQPYFPLFACMLLLCIAPPFANGQEKAAGEDPACPAGRRNLLREQASR